MKTVLINFVLVYYACQSCLAGRIIETSTASDFYESTDLTDSTPDPNVVRKEEELNDLISLAKLNIQNEPTANTADIVMRLIYTNASGLLHSFSESCPPLYDAHGIYTINVLSLDPFPVFCDTKLAGPGWIVVQRRLNGDLNFFRNWTMYKNGFGDISNEFFIGLDKLHAITASKAHELYIFLEDFGGNTRYARYNEFLISDEENSYALSKLGAYSGDAGDSLIKHLNAKFSTYDVDNDGFSDKICANELMGAWWYSAGQYCAFSSLNGLYVDATVPPGFDEKGIYWGHWRGGKYSYKSVQMMIRPKCMHFY